MSASGKTIQDNGVVEPILDDFDLRELIALDDDEQELEQSLLDACLMAENANKQAQQLIQSTQDVEKSDDKPERVSDSIKKNDQNIEEKQDLSVPLPNKSHEGSFESALSVKMEFSCSQERLVEPNMDYTLDDVIEICSIPDEDDEDPVDDVVSSMLKQQAAISDKEAGESIAEQGNNLKDDDDNEDLLTVFNDHTYTSQEVATPAPDVNHDLRQNIINHIVKKRTMDGNASGNGICDDDASSASSNDSAIEENAKKEIEDFVDQILEGKIEEFVGKSVNSNDSDKKNAIHVKTEFNTEAIHTEDFVQNIFYAVADEDAAEYAAEHSVVNRKQKETISESGSEKAQQTEATETGSNTSTTIPEKEHESDQSSNETETFSFQSCSEHGSEMTVYGKETEETATKQHENDDALLMETSNNEKCQQPLAYSTCDSIFTDKEDGSQLGSNVTLSQCCSEPLEVTSLDERFEQFSTPIEEIEITVNKPLEELEIGMEQNEASSLENCLEKLEDNNTQVEASAVECSNHLENTSTPVDTSMENLEELENAVQDNKLETTAAPLEQVEIAIIDPQEIDGDTEKNVQEKETCTNTNECRQKSTLEDNEDVTNKDECQPEIEPLKSPLGSDFERLKRVMNEVENSSTLFKEFSALVNEMHKDCETFSLATTNIDARLGSYIMDKLEIMRALVRCSGKICTATERAVQTDPESSRRRLKKLNKKNKRALLASTDSSSRSSGSSSDEHVTSSDEIKKPGNSEHLPERLAFTDNEDTAIAVVANNSSKDAPGAEEDDAMFEKVISSQLSQASTFNSEGVYDDGVVLSKYLRSDVFSAASSKTKDDKTSGVSTPIKSQSSASSSSEDDTSTPKVKSNEDIVKTKEKASKREAIDENDKEIKRLINLDGLMKRYNNAGPSKQTDIDKQKTKSQNQKNKTDGVLEFLENELPKDTLSSEESANENEEEVITEKQYLERYNQDLKNQLLNDSSNDTSQDEEADDEFAPALSDESDSGNRSPLVDKFLKTYNIEDSEEDDVEMVPDEVTTKETSESAQKADESKKPEDETQPKKEESGENNVAHIPDDSDCELLNDSFIYRKRTQPKSLEKILSEAEKRKKIQKLDEDLISLSSESDCSDVEAVEIEPAENTKSRAIKAMLRPDQLQRETLKAQKSETDRIRRLEKRQSMLSRIIAENTDLKPDKDLILDYNEETKTFIKVHSELVKHLKPHQRDGVRFMYDSCYGGVDSSKKNHGSGCILAHCMGLGKTLQLIALMHTVISYKELKTEKVLVLCPKSTVMNWGDEISRWLFPLRTRNLKVYTFNDTSDINEKLGIMREWSQSTYQKAGCLLIGYEAFRTLVFYHKYKMRNNLDSTRLEKIRELIDEYLLQPGADLVVCDEGHIIKNSKSAISLAVAEIKTQKRIVLTGTPIQNNLKEYYSMVNFIKPLFLGTEKEFANLYANPIKNGQHKDSNKRDIKVMKQRSFVLHKKLSKFVQRKEAELLESFLPKKFEYVLFIPMTNVQNKLYERILETITSRQDHRGRSLITDYTCLRKIWTHPKVLEDAWKNAINQQFKRDSRKQPNSDDDQPDDIYDSQTGFMSVKNDWWRNLIAERDLESILPSNKLRTMFEILRMCEENGDKCLIFSAFVAVLNVVEYFFKKLAEGNKETISELNMLQGTRSMWEPNKDYFRLDGKTSKSTRHEMIKRFNHPHNTRARVFLISAKAGGQGINLIGANRVIILDTSWNPSNDQQNIFRIFRLGQKKNCYIYRLLALGTMEEKVYSRSVTKQAMSFRVMDVQQIDRHYSMAELAELYTLTIPNYAERPTPIFPQDTILANLLRSFPDLVYKYHEHDSLLENKVEQELSEQEKIDAWNAYENDLQMNSQMANMEDMQNRMAQGNMPNYMGSSGSIPGLNLQALLNFRSMNTQSNTSYMNPALLQQYKYNIANQQYLDMINNYRQYSTPEGAAAFNASIAAAYSMNSSMFSGAAPSVSPHHTSSANIPGSSTSHPLSALNDLSLYGLGMNSSTSAAAVAAAAAAATSLAQLPSASTNASSLYATPSMQAQPASTAGLYSNQAASIYQTLQQLGYVGATPSGGNILNNAALNSFTNSASFQAPRRTPPQTASRKSSTPDMTGYRSSSGSVGSVNMSAVTPTTSTIPMPTTTMTSMTSKPNELPKPSNNLNNNNSNSNVNSKNKTEATNAGTRKNDASSNRATVKTAPTSNNSAINIVSIGSTETTTTISQNRPVTAPNSVATTISSSKTSTTSSKNITSRLNSKQPNSSTTIMPTSKNSDPQIRVKDMGLLCANTSRGASLQSVASAAARDMTANSFANTSTNSNNSNASVRSKQSAIDNRLLTATTSATAAELLKARSEMQIIPTTSPPGTASISKQLSEISPSISLTAVRSTNAKPSSTNSGNFAKVPGTNTSTTSSSKTSRMNSPATITHSTLSNRQQTASPIAQPRKNIANSNPISVSNTNLSVNTKKSLASSAAAAAISSMTNLSARKTVATMPQPSLAVTTVTPSALNTNPNIGVKASNAGSVNHNSNNPAKYNFPAGLKGNMATITPATTATTTSGKTITSILRNHQIRKMPSPLPTTIASTSNINSSINASISSNQQNSTGNAKQAFLGNVKAGLATASAVNTGQTYYKSKNPTSVQRSSPTIAISQRTSRTASPGNEKTRLIEKNLTNSGIVVTGNRVNSTTVSTPSTSAGINAFPVHLQRSNSALGTKRTLSPLSTVKAAASGLGNRTKSTTAIVTPKIANVASLNNSIAMAAGSAATSTSTTPSATAARVAALKKFTNNSGKISLQTSKQLQAAASSAQKVAAASSVVQQKRTSVSSGVGLILQQQQQQSQLSKQRINIQANGRTVNVGVIPSRISTGETPISLANVRPTFKGLTTASSSGSTLPNEKRTVVSSLVTSASGQAAMAKLLSERKRKGSDIVYKDAGNLSKRPKES